NESGQANGIKNPLDSDDSTGFQSGAVHENGIHLDFTVAIGMRSDACVEHRLVLQVDDDLLAGIKRGTAVLQRLPTTIESSFDRAPADLQELVRNVPRSAMNGQRDITHFLSVGPTGRPTVGTPLRGRFDIGVRPV